MTTEEFNELSISFLADSAILLQSFTSALANVKNKTTSQSENKENFKSIICEVERFKVNYGSHLDDENYEKMNKICFICKEAYRII